LIPKARKLIIDLIFKLFGNEELRRLNKLINKIIER
jgi:hypothetical protein